MPTIAKGPSMLTSILTTIIALALTIYIFTLIRDRMYAYLSKQSCSADLPDASKTYDVPHAMKSLSLPEYTIDPITSRMLKVDYTKPLPPTKSAVVYGGCPSDSAAVTIKKEERYLTVQPDGKSVKFEDNIRDPPSCWYVEKPGICKQREYNTFSSAAYPGRYLNHTDISDGAKLSISMDRYLGARTSADYCFTNI